MVSLNIDIIPVLVMAVVSMIIGFLWYSQALFGKPWMKLSKINPNKVKKKNKSMAGPMIWAFIATLVLVGTLSSIINLLGINTALGGLGIGFCLWLGFIATTMLNGILWECKPVALYLINVTHYLVVLAVSGIVLAVF